MGHVSVQKTYKQSASRLWEALRDFGGIEKFHPQVLRSPLLSGQASGVGAERKCEFHDGNWVAERVTAWEEGRSLSISFTDGSFPISDGTATITLLKQSEAFTAVRFDMVYVPKMGALGKVMDVLVMRSKFAKVLASVLDGLDLHVRTGAVIGPDGRPQAQIGQAA